MEKKTYNYWPLIKNYLLKAGSKFALKRLGLAVGSFQASLVLWLAEKAIEWVLKPIYLNLVVWVEKKRNIKKGKQQAKDVVDAQTDDEITDAFDNLG